MKIRKACSIVRSQRESWQRLLSCSAFVVNSMSKPQWLEHLLLETVIEIHNP